MGLTGSTHCKQTMFNPDYLSVITLTDSLVQKLPLDSDSSNPLDREAREQNIDDFWRDRMECLENAFMEAMGITEKSFNRMEKKILGMAPPIYKPKCPRNMEDMTTCMMAFPDDPLKCDNYVKKLLLCVDTIAEDETRRACLNAERAKRKAKKCS